MLVGHDVEQGWPGRRSLGEVVKSIKSATVVWIENIPSEEYSEERLRSLAGQL